MYLGVLIHKSLSWSPHISNVVNKASRTLNFLKRNLNKFSKQVKESAYLTMVRPQLEYASAVLDPYHVGDISELEKVQRRAARWVLNDYGRFSSVSLMLDQLKWPTLQVRRKLSRLQILHKIHYQQLSLQIPHYYLPKTRPTRQYHHLHYILPTSSMHHSIPNQLFLKNNKRLEHDTVEIADTDLFTTRFQSYYCT